jgi:predicted transglutaminase-like protease
MLHCSKSLNILVNKREIYIDYAILITSALLSINISPIYIITFDSPKHAVATVTIDNTIFVLRPESSIYRLDNYFNYILQNTPNMNISIFKLFVENGYVVYETSLPPQALQEKYFENMLQLKASSFRMGMNRKFINFFVLIVFDNE